MSFCLDTYFLTLDKEKYVQVRGDYMNNEEKELRLGEKSLAVVCPELCKEWHPTKNGDLTPDMVSYGSGKKVWWYLSYYDEKKNKTFELEWEARITGRVKGRNCPYLTGNKVLKGFNDFETEHPELAKEWHPTKNKIRPDEVSSGSDKKVWWLMPYYDEKTGKTFKFEWQATINNRVKESGCPYLCGHKVYRGFNDLETLYPELSKQWDYRLNGKLKPYQVTAGSEKKVWWHCEKGHTWKSAIDKRVKGQGCPYCSGSKTELLIYDYLRNRKILVEKEFQFENSPIRFYKFDLYLFQYRLMIEVDGIQHFQDVGYFRNIPFETRVLSDNRKNEYCLSQSIPMLRIPYIYSPKKDSEKIIDLVLEFSRTRKIPQEIIDFYEQYAFSNYSEIAKQMNALALQQTA